jgi:CheY-like chemotaxis protein
MEAGHGLQGLRLLVVEDEILVAMIIEEMCADLGCEVVASAATVAEAVECARRQEFDVALVDMNLGGARADPVIAELHGRSIPFAIASGGAVDLNDDIRAAAVLNKPFDFRQFNECLTTLAACLAANGSE